MAPAPERVVALVTHARTVPAIERGRFAARLREGPPRGAILVETCHRVEAYLPTPDDPARLGETFRLPEGARILVGRDAVRHAIAVAVGSDSVVVGEDQILHQLRGAVAAARLDGRLDSELERLFALALRAGRRARSWRQGRQPSLADLALEVMARRTRSLRGRKLLVVGAGRMGRLAAVAAIAAGAKVSVASRSDERAGSLASETGAQAEAFDPGARAGAFAAVLVALGGPWPLGPAAMNALAASRTVVVDLSVPPAVPTAAAGALGDRLVTADDLALVEGRTGPAASSSDRRVEDLVERTISEFLDWSRARDGRSAAEALVRRADLEREAELEQLWRRHPDLQPELRDAIERMTESFARRLLREPLERLGRDTDGRNERAVRDLFAV
ncbi:MAG: NAD(P)-binding domain-containing protein [Chloroflexi bacterium]|nr:NAD(P)-binding domain-containing protein [Chloroflexota bacterium]